MFKRTVIVALFIAAIFLLLPYAAPAVTLAPLGCKITPVNNVCGTANYDCIPGHDGLWVGQPSGTWKEWSTIGASEYIRAWLDDIEPGAACTGSHTSILKSQAAVEPDAPPPPPTEAAIKWHPGWYPYISNFHWNTDPNVEGPMKDLFAFITSTCANPAIKGYAIHKMWYEFEGAQGDYTKGYAMIDQIKDKLATCTTPKKLIVILEPASYGGTGSGLPATYSSGSGVYPQYIRDTSGYVILNTTTTAWPGGLKTVAAFWRAPVMDRLIALKDALCARYDEDPAIEMYQPIGVTSLQPKPYGSNGYTHEAAMTQIYRMLASGGCAHTMLRMPADFMDHQMMVDLGNAVASTRNWVWGDFDPELPLPGPITRFIESHRSFRGEYSGTAYPDITGNVDLRGKVPYVAETQALGNGDCTYGNAYGIPSPQNLYDYFKGCTGTGLCASHYIILRNNWTACGTTTNYWTPNWLPFITAHPDLNTTPPTNIGTVNTN